MEAFMQGFLLQAGLVFGLGAQNLFVLDSGIKRRKHLLVAFLCSIFDLLFIGFGVLGAASFFIMFPNFKVFIGGVGVFFLLYYGLIKLKEFFKETTIEMKESTIDHSTKAVVLATLGFTFLNPHVYLDTWVLIGGFSTKYELVDHRILFGLGASIFSSLWFIFLSTTSAKFSKFLSQPKSMKIVSLVSSLILFKLSYSLGKDVFNWMA